MDIKEEFNKCIKWRAMLNTVIHRVFIRKTFAQFLRNATQNFSFFAYQFCAKKQQFRAIRAKVISRKIALFRFCETQVLQIPQLEFCAIPQFRKMCFLEFNSGKILFWNVFLLVTFT